MECGTTNNIKNMNATASPNGDLSTYFDIELASRSFESSMMDRNAISLHHYLLGFKELMK